MEVVYGYKEWNQWCEDVLTRLPHNVGTALCGLASASLLPAVRDWAVANTSSLYEDYTSAMRELLEACGRTEAPAVPSYHQARRMRKAVDALSPDLTQLDEAMLAVEAVGVSLYSAWGYWNNANLLVGRQALKEPAAALAGLAQSHYAIKSGVGTLSHADVVRLWQDHPWLE